MDDNLDRHVMDDDQEWREVKGFPGYFVSENGDVYSEKRDRLLTPRPVQGGRYALTLSRGWKGAEKKLVDHLVAEAFLPTPDNTRWRSVLHLDEDPTNNHYTNLIW